MPLQTDSAKAARKKAVNDYVKIYTAGFSAPVPSSSPTALSEDTKVVMGTGAPWSLGGHLVDLIA